MTGPTDEPPRRDPVVVLGESVELLALVATRRLYDEQPRLWDLGENGRARTLEDFTHHLRRLASLSAEVFAEHVAYCERLFDQRGFPRQWLADAWRTIEAVLEDELPDEVATPALAVLRDVTATRG